MSDPDRIREREHWQAIAEQLGLAPEPEESSAFEPSPDQAPVRGEEERVTEPPAPLVEPAERPEDKPPPQRGRRRRSGGADEGRPQRAESGRPTEEPAVKETDAEPARPHEERPAPRRGHRRRSARASVETEREATDSTFSAEASSEEEATGKAAEGLKRRGRGRGRQKKAQPVKVTEKAATDEETGDQVAAPEGAEDAELDDVRSLSNWNAPSWNELISSLYRPER